MTADDVAALTLSAAGLGVLVGIAELLHRRFRWSSRASRRLVHLGTGLFVVAIPWLFTHAAPVYLLAAAFVVINGITAARGWLRGMNPAEMRSWGTVAFPLALLVLLPFCWGEERQFILQTAFLVLAVADPLAAMVGERSGGPRVRIEGAEKSLAGSVVFFATAWVLTLSGVALLGGSSVAEVSAAEPLLVGGLVALVATAAEALGGRGWDNLFIVVAAGGVLLFWSLDPQWLGSMVAGGALGLGFAGVAWRLEYLTLSGAIAGGLFAATLVGIGGWGWMIPGLVFFFLSSALSKLAPERKGGAAVRESRRDASQVYANGGVAWALVVAHALAPHAWIYWGFVGSLAAATADTWASEVGPLFREQPRMILSRRAVPAGTSGAITRGGTLAGAAGALVIWASAWWTAPEGTAGMGLATTLLAVGLGGVLGSLVDSVAGATIEAVYRDPLTGRLTDDRQSAEAGGQPVRGWKPIDNQVVNALCTAVGGLVAMLIVAW